MGRAREPKICRLQMTLVVFMRIRLLLITLVFQLKKEKIRKIMIHCSDQSYKHSKSTKNKLEIFHRCWITYTHIRLVTIFFFTQRLWSSKDLKTFKAFTGWKSKKDCNTATLKLQYYVNWRANFNLNKFENLSIWLER